jgi:hypothetical protein
MKNNELLKIRISKLEKHYEALSDYHRLILALMDDEDIFTNEVFLQLLPEQKALFDAFLKRFSSLQDFMGAKIFPQLLQMVGIFTEKMSEILYHAEKEGLIDSLNDWIELREMRNDLEHDYPDDLEKALLELKRAVGKYDTLERYYFNIKSFVRRVSGETF